MEHSLDFTPIAGGLIFLDPKMFLSFCVHGASLRVRLDPDNLINETDELNNAADISGMNITGGSQNYCNGKGNVFHLTMY